MHMMFNSYSGNTYITVEGCMLRSFAAQSHQHGLVLLLYTSKKQAILLLPVGVDIKGIFNQFKW